MTPPSPPDRRGLSRTLLNISLAIIGAVLLLVTVRRVGWNDVQRGLGQVGWWFLLILLLGGLRFAARARAWMVSAAGVIDARAADSVTTTVARNPARQGDHAAGNPLSTTPFLGAVLAADAVGNLTPLGMLASEPAKILLVRDRLPTLAAISSVAIENACYIASVVAMLVAGAVVFVNVTNLPAGLQVSVEVVFVGAAVAALAAVVIARRKPALLSRLARFLSTLTGRGLTSSERLAEIERQFYGMLRWPASRLSHVMAWEAAFHVAAVAEVYLVLQLLPADGSPSLADAFVLETTGRLIAVVFKFVPYRLGVDEAGAAIVATALAIDPTVGVTLALIRRLRILCWNAVGLLMLARSR